MLIFVVCGAQKVLIASTHPLQTNVYLPSFKTMQSEYTLWSESRRRGI